MLVWDPVVRIAHWILAACVIAAWFTRGATHDGLGYGAIGVVALRLVWGWVGPRHAHFGEFVRSPASTLAYARAVLAGVEPRYLGHNPLGAWMIVALLAMIALVAGTGWLSTTDRFWGVEWLQETHHVLADALRAERALAIRDGKAHQRGAHIPALELDQHAHGELARHLAEQAILAGEMVVDGLLCDAGAARDLIDARGIAMREKGIGRGAQYALAVFNRHWSSPGT